MDAFVLPQCLGRLARAVLKSVKAIAGSGLQVECLQQILNRRIFGGVTDKDDLKLRQ